MIAECVLCAEVDDGAYDPEYEGHVCALCSEDLYIQMQAEVEEFRQALESEEYFEGEEYE